MSTPVAVAVKAQSDPIGTTRKERADSEAREGASTGAVRAHSHVRELLADTLTPLAAYQRLAKTSPYAFLLESVTGGEQVSRYSFLGAGPSEVLALYLDRLETWSPESAGAPQVLETTTDRPLQALRERLERVHSEDSSLPLVGGFVGYFGWDLARLLEHLPNRPSDPFGLPVALLARFDTVIAFDHARQRLQVISNAIAGEVDDAEANARLDRLEALLTAPAPSGAVVLRGGLPDPVATLPPTLSDAEYCAAVERAKEYIAAGDIFQVVPARRFDVEDRIEPVALYRALRVVNPSPYMVLFTTPRVSLVGASPEMLVRFEKGRFEYRPIAGTRPRGGSAARDLELAAEMLADPKERAEHVMLVDLGRNDLGRVASPGAVRVTELMQVEYYSHVMHLVSDVEAEPRAGATALDALLACFPAGTLSGAPKIRAIEIIDELEPAARGPYGGAVGYLSFNGAMDTCITIRTLVVEPDRISITAGAGIVADSVPELEAQETRNKAAGMLQAVALARQLGGQP
jgi:anthranilate synthase component 1